MSKYLEKQIFLPVGTVLRMVLKYRSSSISKKKSVNIKYYVSSIFFKVVEDDITCTLRDIEFVITNIILKSAFCRIQSNQIQWTFVTILTGYNVIARFPVKECYGHISSSETFRFTFHLYRNKRTPCAYNLEGVSSQIISNTEYQDILYEISRLFTENLPIVHSKKCLGRLRFVRLTNNHNKMFLPFDLAYPWGKANPKRNRKKRT